MNESVFRTNFNWVNNLPNRSSNNIPSFKCLTQSISDIHLGDIWVVLDIESTASMAKTELLKNYAVDIDWELQAFYHELNPVAGIARGYGKR